MPVITLYDDTIDKDATRTEVHQSKGKMNPREMNVRSTKRPMRPARNSSWELSTRRGTRSSRTQIRFIQTSHPSNSLNISLSSVSGIHTVDAVDIPKVMKTIFSYAEGIPQFINAMETAQQKYKQEKLVIHDKYMHAVALKSLLQ